MVTVNRQVLQEALQQAQGISQQATSGQGFDPRGGVGVLAAQLATAGIGAFAQNRARKKIAEEDQASQQSFESKFPQFAGLSDNLSPSTREAFILKQATQQPLSKQGKVASDVKRGFLEAGTQQSQEPLSPQGKLLQDVKAGLVPASIASKKLQSEQPIFVNREVRETTDINEKIDILEAASQQNIAQGNVREGGLQAKKARDLRKENISEQKLIEKDSRKLSSELEKSDITNLIDSLETVSSIINSNPKDIPGFGATSAVPGVFLETEGKQLRQSLATLRNSILKARSGGAVTPSEAKRLLEELGSGIGRDDEQLRIGVQNTINAFKNKVANIKGGFRPESVDLVTQRSGSDIFERMAVLNIGQNPTQPPQPTQAAAQPAQPNEQQAALAELKRRGLVQ